MNARSQEEWRPIEGQPYEVSDLGRLRRTTGWYSPMGKILKPRINRYGYALVTLHSNNRRWSVCVHTLVAVAFHGPRPQGLEVNHKDGNKINNDVRNLEYVTRRENFLHAFRTGLMASVVRIGPEKANEIRRVYATGRFTQKYLAKRYGVSQPSICRVVRGKTWKEDRKC